MARTSYTWVGAGFTCILSSTKNPWHWSAACAAQMDKMDTGRDVSSRFPFPMIFLVLKLGIWMQLMKTNMKHSNMALDD